MQGLSPADLCKLGIRANFVVWWSALEYQTGSNAFFDALEQWTKESF